MLAELRCGHNERLRRTSQEIIVEALARWKDPERGFVPPDLFIPLVEDLGLMNHLPSSILRQACRDAKHWSGDIRLSVNISLLT
jgi:predicted signal transduction protein with EAL and GGDEF domain